MYVTGTRPLHGSLSFILSVAYRWWLLSSMFTAWFSNASLDSWIQQIRSLLQIARCSRYCRFNAILSVTYRQIYTRPNRMVVSLQNKLQVISLIFFYISCSFFLFPSPHISSSAFDLLYLMFMLFLTEISLKKYLHHS